MTLRVLPFGFLLTSRLTPARGQFTPTDFSPAPDLPQGLLKAEGKSND